MRKLQSREVQWVDPHYSDENVVLSYSEFGIISTLISFKDAGSEETKKNKSFENPGMLGHVTT